MTDRELMQMALDALEAALSNDQPYISRSEETAEALRARLAQPEPEPVAWADKYDLDREGHDFWVSRQANVRTGVPLYTAPPQQPEPEQEIDPDRPHVEDDGCPTEKAVLQRFWREHQAQPERKLWLWKNFVDGRPEYWAFDNPYPTNLDNGDPQTLGQPCGYAIFKPSRDGSRGRTEEQVLREMESVSARSEREWQGLTDKEYETMAEKYVTNYFFDTLKYAKAIEAKLKEKNS